MNTDTQELNLINFKNQTKAVGVQENLPNNQNSILPRTPSLAKKKSIYVGIIIGNRIPRKFFWTSGVGESDITIHAGSYHLALKEAGIERYNIMVYSSIMPSIAIESDKPKPEEVVHGSVLESIMAVVSGKRGKRLTAGVIYGWLYHKVTGKKYGGLVCEYSGNEKEENAHASLKASLNELYTNGFSEDYDLKGIRLESRSFIPKKKFGTAMVVIGFKDYLYPVVQ